MGKTTFVALRTIVLVVKLSANVFGWLRSNNLPFDRVRKKTVEAVLAVSHVEMDAWVKASLYVQFSTFSTLLGGSSRAFIDCEVLVSTQIFDALKLTF